MQPRNILYVFRNAPHGNLSGREGLDALLTGGAFDQSVSVLFMDDGIYQIVRGQDAKGIIGKDYTRAWGAVGDFCDSLQQGGIFVEGESMTARGVGEDDLAVKAEIVSSGRLRELFEGQHAVVNF